MLQKIHRLPAHVRLSSSRSYSSSLFLLKVSNNNLEVSRFGFVVSKKTDARATTRNRIRRVFRSCIEEMLPEIISGVDMLFLPKAGILEIQRKELYNEVHKFLSDKQLLR